MKTSYKLILTLLLFLVASISMTAQISDPASIQRRAAEKCGQMNMYISKMASKQRTPKIRQYYRTKALNLFIGQGGEYEEDGVTKRGVMMEVTSVNRRSVSHRLMTDYFTSLINLGYSDVQITSTDIADIKVSTLKRINDNLYVCTCQFDQAFAGYRDGKAVYKDITTKRVKCYVELERNEDGLDFIIRLGDVTALQTKRL